MTDTKQDSGCLAVIPFAGFYSSCHSEAIDHAAAQTIADENGDRRDGPLPERFDSEFSYTDAMLEAYGKEYVAAWQHASGIACAFRKIDSPKYYNFETDRIFVTVQESVLFELFDGLDKTRMSEIAASRHTSCSGFISFYSPDWHSWGEVETWEPEQLHTLLLASLPDDMPEEYELVDDCNGAVSNLVYDHMPDKAKRLVRISDYLRARDERKRRR